MAIEDDISASDMFFVGDDKTLAFEIFDEDGVAGGTMQDVSGFAMQFDLRKGVEDADPAIITKATGGSGITITGSYNSVRATNTQRVNVAITDSDTESLRAGDYEYTLKRTDSGAETTLAFGTITLRKGTVR